MKECNPSIKKILNNALPHLLNKLLGEIEDLSTNSIQPLLGDESNAAANEEATAAHYRFLKALSEKHKTLKIILQNLSLILELNPRGNEKEKNEISNLLARAEHLIEKKIVSPARFEEDSSTQDSSTMNQADSATNHSPDNND